ncbi:alpha-amylase family glycosyl hydrolase [Pullulanibacillus sp. KACC 23026]|uniref:alpha-amylase family glycosyl hydrolase n=1 Tax=Pullulanibacillus sp. KACC 23026 TaxID=3028315 RepID=UPI0023B038C5|nr:alpha-amylase family glycosyl hydrolase [Pullulanibacillus sp. KACC 23026]WEG13179.1 alpha-amylase family glycosyl hydrolase [Pullulanibacillus sp. KACC 23026]
MKKRLWTACFSICLSLVMLTGCATGASQSAPKSKGAQAAAVKAPVFTETDFAPNSSHDIYYEIFVRSFADSNGDGIGDLKGITEKLSYLKKLGVQGIWLTPIFESPSYHGYDVTDYYKINPDFGTEADLKNLVSKAHQMGIKVLLDLVVNHTSDQNPWFKKALADDPTYKNYYIWKKPADSLDQQGDWGEQVWQTNGDQVYEGVFDKSMPDLNYDNPVVRQQVIKIGQYWLKNDGVDGYRLDAAMHIYSNWQYPDAAEKNAQWWTEFYDAMKQVNPKTYLVGEVWDDPTVIAPYLKSALTSGFNFDLSTQILDAAKSESDNGLVSRLEAIRSLYAKQNSDFKDSTFITNHDMDRTMSQLNDNVNDAKMAASLLLTLPGNPFIYYGEEIGMQGSGPDEAKREPFIWSSDPNDKTTTSWEPTGVNDTGKIALNVEEKDPNSMYNWYKNLIYARRSSPILMDGELQDTNYTVDGLITFKRVLNQKSLLVLTNMTGKAKSLKLSKEDRSYKNVYFETSKKVKTGKTISLPAYSTVILSP